MNRTKLKQTNKQTNKQKHGRKGPWNPNMIYRNVWLARYQTSGINVQTAFQNRQAKQKYPWLFPNFAI